MRKAIGSGSVLIKEGVLLPDMLTLEAEPFAHGWTLVKNLNAEGMNRKIGDAGWNFFCLAGEISATCIGLQGQNTDLRAMRRILASAELEKFNSVEILRLVPAHFLGLPYTTVYAHLRHVQKGIVLLRPEAAQAPHSKSTLGSLKPVVGHGGSGPSPSEAIDVQPHGAYAPQ
jgi:hypothetical protein